MKQRPAYTSPNGPATLEQQNPRITGLGILLILGYQPRFLAKPDPMFDVQLGIARQQLDQAWRREKGLP